MINKQNVSLLFQIYTNLIFHYKFKKKQSEAVEKVEVDLASRLLNNDRICF